MCKVLSLICDRIHRVMAVNRMVIIAACLLTATTAASCSLPGTIVPAPDVPTSASSTPTSSTATPSDLPAEFSKLADVWNTLQEQYVNPNALDPVSMVDGAIQGMLNSLEDRHTFYVDPKFNAIQNEDLAGEYQGIGAYVDVYLEDSGNGTFTHRPMILAPMPGSPAEQVGIMSGDIILAVDGESTDQMTLMESVMRIRGPVGTPVRLLVLHPDSLQPEEVTVTRGLVKAPSVHFDLRGDISQGEPSLPEGVNYIYISSFTERTPSELDRILSQIQDQRTAQSIILDVRNNPGGLLQSTVAVIDHFLATGVILHELHTSGDKRSWNASAQGKALDVPLVVLVNERTASGGEVLAGALQDHHRAIIVGTATYGKASVNRLHSLGDGSAITVTEALWLTPNETTIQHKGITPDVQIENRFARDPAGDIHVLDKQFESALEVLLTRTKQNNQ